MRNRELIVCRNLCVKSRSASLLKDISFTLREGEHKVIIGPNGAGKSTLIKTILRGHSIDAGEILINGINIEELSQKMIAKQVSYVPQLLTTEIPYTVKEFVAMGRYTHKGNDSDCAVKDAMEAVHVMPLANRVVSTLSGGERQRVCIAAALAQKTPILLLDEPLAHLDPRQKNDVQQALEDIQKNVTMMVVTHDLNWARNQFKSLLSICSGVSNYDGFTDNFYTKKGIEKLYGKQVHMSYK